MKNSTRTLSTLLFGCLSVILTSGCGTGLFGGIKVTAGFYKGGGNGSRALTAPRAVHARLADGSYQLSPDEAKVKYTKADFITASGKSVQVTFGNCEFTYKRTEASGAKILDCAFSLEEGSYVSMILSAESNVPIKISDSTLGLFTDSSASGKLSLTEPAGGADFVDYFVPNGGSNTGDTDISFQIVFPTPIVVTGDNVVMSVVTDMTRTISMTVTGGVPSLDASSGARPVEFMGMTGAGGHSEYYNAIAFEWNGVADNREVRIFYDGDNNAVGVQSTACLSGNAASAAFSMGLDLYQTIKTDNYDPGYYLGKDSSDNVSWASPDGSDIVLQSIVQKTTLGAATNLVCKTIPGGPATLPTSGDTYASGMPAPLGTPDTTIGMHLHTM